MLLQKQWKKVGLKKPNDSDQGCALAEADNEVDKVYNDDCRSPIGDDAPCSKRAKLRHVLIAKLKNLSPYCDDDNSVQDEIANYLSIKAAKGTLTTRFSIGKSTRLSSQLECQPRLFQSSAFFQQLALYATANFPLLDPKN